MGALKQCCRWGRAFFLALSGLFIFIFLFITLILGNFLQISSLVLYPFSRKLFRSFNTFLAAWWWGMGAFFLKLTGVKVNIIGDDIVSGENSVILSNHQCWCDVPVLFRLAILGKQIGHMKWFVKDRLKYVPGMGVAMMFVNTFFLKRSWQEDRVRIQKQLAFFAADSIPFWLMIFPEGTRFNKQKLKRSNKFAIEGGRSALTHVLYPRTKGFVAAMSGLSNHCKSIYDFTIAYNEGNPPSFFGLFLGHLKSVSVHVRRFDFEDIKQDSEALKNWLIDCFYEKDQIIEGILDT